MYKITKLVTLRLKLPQIVTIDYTHSQQSTSSLVYYTYMMGYHMYTWYKGINQSIAVLLTFTPAISIINMAAPST